MGMNSLPKSVTRQGRDCDLNPGRSAPESSTLTIRLPSHPHVNVSREIFFVRQFCPVAFCARGQLPLCPPLVTPLQR